MSDHDYLEFRHLKYVLAIAIAGNFGTAANNLYLAQSSLGTQIQKLEEYYGIQIFVRDREGVSGLTEIGRVLIAAAEDFLKQRDALVDLIVTGPQPRSGSVSPRSWKSEPLNRLSISRVPSTRAATSSRMEMLSKGSNPRSGRVNFTPLWVTLPLVDSEGLTTHKIERERLVVRMRNDDPLAEHEAIPAHRINGKLALFEYPLVHDRYRIDPESQGAASCTSLDDPQEEAGKENVHREKPEGASKTRESSTLRIEYRSRSPTRFNPARFIPIDRGSTLG